MPKPLTPTDKARLRQHAESLQLWVHARGHHCGPRSEGGKHRSAMRALKHGLASEGGIAMARWLASLNRVLAALNKLCDADTVTVADCDS